MWPGVFVSVSGHTSNSCDNPVFSKELISNDQNFRNKIHKKNLQSQSGDKRTENYSLDVFESL